MLFDQKYKNSDNLVDMNLRLKNCVFCINATGGLRLKPRTNVHKNFDYDLQQENTWTGRAYFSTGKQRVTHRHQPALQLPCAL